MPAACTEVADALVAQLNAWAFSLSFTAQREPIDFQDELPATAGVRVSVVGRSIAGEPDSHNSERQTIEVDVAVRSKCDVSNVATTDALVDLMDEIRSHLLSGDRRLAGYDAAVLLSWKGLPYLPDHARGMRQFTSVITFTYAVHLEYE